MPVPSARHIEPLLTLTADGVLAGTISATSTLSGALTVTAADAGTITATSTLTGALTVRAPAAGTIPSTSSLTGTITSKAALAGTIAATTTLTGTLTNAAAKPLAGTITAQSTLTGDLTIGIDIPLEGLIASTSNLTGDLTSEEPPPPPSPHVPGTRIAIHWFWEPGNHSEMPDPPKVCPECGAPVVVMSLDAEVYCRHYELAATKTDGSMAEADCPYIATINESNYAQPLPADIAAGYVLTAPVA